jgi:fructokinase
MSIWVCGEVLIDVLPETAVVGGGPANTARALARLGEDVEFIGGISSDAFGQRVKKELIEDGVGLRHSHESDQPTSTATVTLRNDGSATYAFSINGTATFDFSSWLPDAYRYKPSLLYIGSLATIVEPGCDALLKWARALSEFAPIIFDPNIRPAVLADRDEYLRKVEQWIGISSIVKVSDEDLLWLCPNQDPYEVARKWIGDTNLLVIITRGADGLSALSNEGLVEVSGIKVEAVDTVGAGDTVGAILAQGLNVNSLIGLRGETLLKLLRCASVAAAITCSRIGANPPTQRELRAALEMQA